MTELDDLRLEIAALRRENAELLRRAEAAERALAASTRPVASSVGDVTSRKELEELMREGEERYRHLIEELPEPILVHVDGLIAYANAASARALGLPTAEALLGRSITELAGGPSRAQIERRMQRALAPGEQLEIAEQSFSRTDGAEVHAEVKSIRITFDGKPAVLSIARDITARVEAERAMKAAFLERERVVASLDFERRRMARLLEKAPSVIAIVRGKDHVVELLNEVGRAFIAHREATGRPLAELVPELGPQGIIHVLDTVFQTGQSAVIEGLPIALAEYPGAPLVQHYMNVVHQAFVEPDGTISGVFIYAVDVTQATVIQQRVRAQFHGVPVPTYVWQRIAKDGRARFKLVDFNHAAITASEGDIANHVGQWADDRFHDSPQVPEDLARCLAEETVIEREVDRRLTRTGEVRHLHVTFAPAPPDLVIAHVEDITDRTMLEEQLRQAQKMEAVGRLAGGVAHDFNNLLTVILSYAEICLQELHPGEPLREELLEIETAAHRAGELTRQLLAFSRQQVLLARVIDLGEIVLSMQSMLARLLGEDVELTLRLQPGTSRVFADPGQIEQVLMNLAVNARDAMPEGGRLTIEVADAVVEHRDEGEAEPDCVALSVTDTGVGMDAAVQARIFDPFFTTKEKGKGTGLGLAMVLGIVEQSGGRVLADSAPGEGSTFRILLPRTSREPDPAAPRSDPRQLCGSETVLLVEDEQQVRGVTCAILRRHGYEVIEAADGEEAIRVAAGHPEPLDLLLTDVVMPRMGGRKLAEHLAPVRPEMRVLFASGYTDEAIIHHGVQDAGMAFLQKPFTAESLLRKVREVLDAPTAPPPGAADAPAPDRR